MSYTKRELLGAVRALEDSYNATRELTPADTVKHFTDSVGEELAKTTVAILIKRDAWDGRISQRSVAWAEGYTTETADIYTTIHKAHLEQIAQEMRKSPV